MGLVYRIENGRLWGVDAACFFEIAPDDAEIVQLYADGNLAGEDYLIRTLRFYGHPLGELTPLDDLRAAKLAEIAAGYDAALTATLTMPAASPGSAEIALAVQDFLAEDAEGLEYVRGLLAARRGELERAARAAQTREALEAVRVDYPV
ncbi:MAG: hypothetical protein MR460_08625 [Bilophila wadsworthia]|uniref:hypothetical protein n=1 Tax=Bilophila wadsworthia TaxID=35833 RepID=UPI00242B27A5|nr:hypothetical protein [Bilophila wadsworthia]MCI6540189.1 hypothetical protein [Bilophila wadsworthia]MDY3681870.1 hypothetical protein [Bilophila wadsworthia]